MTKAGILAAIFGWDISEIRACRYQPTVTKFPVWNPTGNRYFTVSKTQPKNDEFWTWVPHTDQFWASQFNTTIWVAET